ncbi:hypothetical protein ACOSQ4_005099 [Xanthoceras sorbifolium]
MVSLAMACSAFAWSASGCRRLFLGQPVELRYRSIEREERVESSDKMAWSADGCRQRLLDRPVEFRSVKRESNEFFLERKRRKS